MSYIPAQDYELGTVWVPLYSHGQIFMVPIRPKPIRPNHLTPKPYNPRDPYEYWEHPMGGNQQGMDPYEQLQIMRGEIRRRFGHD